MAAQQQIVALVAGQAPNPVLCRLEGGTGAIYSITINNANSPSAAFLYPNHNSPVDTPITVPAFSAQTIPLHGVKNCYVQYATPLVNGSAQVMWDDDQSKTASGFITNVSQFPAGSIPFDYQTARQVLTTGTLPLTFTGIATGNAGQKIYLTKFKLTGLAPQKYQVIPTFVGHTSTTIYNTYPDNQNGADYDDNLAEAYPIGPLSINEGLDLKITSSYGDAVQGSLPITLFLLGYVL